MLELFFPHNEKIPPCRKIHKHGRRTSKAKKARRRWRVFFIVYSRVFFLPRENKKCRRKRFLVLFLVFFSGRIFLLAHFFEIFSRAVLSFSGTFFVFFHGFIFFSRAEICEFSRADFFFLGRNLRIFSGIFFFSGRIFFSAGVKFLTG